MSTSASKRKASPSRKRETKESAQESAKTSPKRRRQNNAKVVHLVTPTATSSSDTTTPQRPVDLTAKRKLFLEGNAAAVTPSRQRETEILPHQDSPAKRKLIFGRLTTEVAVKDSVRKVYAIVRKLTGSLGGNGSHGPIYGELTMGSMQKIINLMKEHTGFDETSRFIDVGSGIGKPNLHVTQDPGVEFSYGIEVEYDRWILGLNCLKGVLDEAVKEENETGSTDIQHHCYFAHNDMRDAKTFDPFTHVYMFSIGFPPDLWEVLAAMWNRSSSPYLICYHAPKDIISRYEFQVELIQQTSTSMHGSKEGHMGYIYRRVPFQNRPPTNKCDPLFTEAWKITQSGLVALREVVDKEVALRMKSGTQTRSRRREGS